MSQFKQLEAFVSVIEQGGFAAAGTKLHLTSAAISKQVKALEESLAAELIKRDTRNFALTEIGTQYFEKAKVILAQLKEANLMISQTQVEPTGTLKIVSHRHFAEHIILPKLPLFLKNYPKLTLKLELAERFPDLNREEIDLLLGVSLEMTDFIQKKIGETRYIFCASPAYLQEFGTPKKPEDLKSHHYLTHSMREKPQFVEFKNHSDVFVEPHLWLNDSNALRECAVQGLGIVKLHDYFVKEDIAAGRLIEVYPNQTEPKQALYLYYRKGRYLEPKTKAFIDFYSP